MFEVDSAAVDWLWHLLAMREVEVCLHTHFCLLFVFFFVWLPIDRLINYHGMEPVMSKNLGPQPLEPQPQTRIFTIEPQPRTRSPGSIVWDIAVTGQAACTYSSPVCIN